MNEPWRIFMPVYHYFDTFTTAADFAVADKEFQKKGGGGGAFVMPFNRKRGGGGIILQKKTTITNKP